MSSVSTESTVKKVDVTLEQVVLGTVVSNNQVVQLDNPQLKIVQVAQQGLPGALGTDLNYTHTQTVASSEWEIAHNLGKCPSVTIVDSSNDKVWGDVKYIDENRLVIKFSAPFGGTAYLN